MADGFGCLNGKRGGETGGQNGRWIWMLSSQNYLFNLEIVHRVNLSKETPIVINY